jgi:hypothetical protein
MSKKVMQRTFVVKFWYLQHLGHKPKNQRPFYKFYFQKKKNGQK